MVIGLGNRSKSTKTSQKFKEFIYFYNKNHSSPNKWTNFSGMDIEQISNQLTEKIKSEFKTQMTNRYATCRENNEVDNFIKHCL